MSVPLRSTLMHGLDVVQMNENEISPVRIFLACIMYGLPALILLGSGALLKPEHPITGRLLSFLGLVVILWPAVKKAADTYPLRLRENVRRVFKRLFYLKNFLLFSMMLILFIEEAFPSAVNSLVGRRSHRDR